MIVGFEFLKVIRDVVHSNRSLAVIPDFIKM